MVLKADLPAGHLMGCDDEEVLPEGSVLTRRFLMLRVAERFGLDPAAVWAKSPAEQAELAVFERMRQDQEHRLAMAQIGVRL
jgi:hypothetical protein